MARFASFTDCDINNLIINKNSQNTKKQIEKQYNVFMAYCKEKALTFVKPCHNCSLRWCIGEKPNLQYKL